MKPLAAVLLAMLVAGTAYAGNFYRPIYMNSDVPSAICSGDECIVEVPHPVGGWKIAGWKLGAEFGRNDVVRCNTVLYFDRPEPPAVDHFNRESLAAPGQQDVQWLPSEAYYTPDRVFLGSRTKDAEYIERGCRGTVWIYSEKPAKP